MLELNWKIGNPKGAGMYFVAAEYGPAAGVFDFMEWDGEKWDCYPTIKIIGFLDLQDFKNQLHIKWPREETVPHVRRELTDEELDFKEV